MANLWGSPHLIEMMDSQLTSREMGISHDRAQSPASTSTPQPEVVAQILRELVAAYEAPDFRMKIAELWSERNLQDRGSLEDLAPLAAEAQGPVFERFGLPSPSWGGVSLLKRWVMLASRQKGPAVAEVVSLARAARTALGLAAEDEHAFTSQQALAAEQDSERKMRRRLSMRAAQTSPTAEEEAQNLAAVVEFQKIYGREPVLARPVQDAFVGSTAQPVSARVCVVAPTIAFPFRTGTAGVDQTTTPRGALYGTWAIFRYISENTYCTLIGVDGRDPDDEKAGTPVSVEMWDNFQTVRGLSFPMRKPHGRDESGPMRSQTGPIRTNAEPSRTKRRFNRR